MDNKSRCKKWMIMEKNMSFQRKSSQEKKRRHKEEKKVEFEVSPNMYSGKTMSDNFEVSYKR